MTSKLVASHVENPTAYLLVHGTWAPQAPWTRVSSEMREVLGSIAANSEFHCPQWTGWNRFLSRHKASYEIERSLESLHPSQSVFIIAHSHGGSAVAYSVNRRPDLHDRIDGVCYLSTPFIAIKERIGNIQLLRTFLIIGGIALYIILALAIAYFLSASGIQVRDDFVISFLLFGSTALSTISLIMVWRLMKRVGVWNELISRDVKVLVDKNDTCRLLLREKSIFIRVTGDEAASALSFWQFLSWLSAFLGDALALFSNKAYFLFSSALARYSLTAAILIFAAFAQMWVIGYVDFINTEEFVQPWEYVVSADINYLFFQLPYPFATAIKFFSILSLILLFITTIFALLVAFFTIFRFAICLFGLRSFGIWAPWQALFVDFAVEAIPFGDNLFHNVNWNDADRTQPTLFHSRSYTNKVVLNYIAAWIHGRLDQMRQPVENE